MGGMILRGGRIYSPDRQIRTIDTTAVCGTPAEMNDGCLFRA